MNENRFNNLMVTANIAIVCSTIVAVFLIISGCVDRVSDRNAKLGAKTNPFDPVPAMERQR